MACSKKGIWMIFWSKVWMVNVDWTALPFCLATQHQTDLLIIWTQNVSLCFVKKGGMNYIPWMFWGKWKQVWFQVQTSGNKCVYSSANKRKQVCLLKCKQAWFQVQTSVAAGVFLGRTRPPLLLCLVIQHQTGALWVSRFAPHVHLNTFQCSRCGVARTRIKHWEARLKSSWMTSFRHLLRRCGIPDSDPILKCRPSDRPMSLSIFVSFFYIWGACVSECLGILRSTSPVFAHISFLPMRCFTLFSKLTLLPYVYTNSSNLTLFDQTDKTEGDQFISGILGIGRKA